MTQLQRLAEPVRPKYVSQLPGKGNADYVPHSVITELLLLIVGPFDYEVTQPIRGSEGHIDGCLARLTVDVDGRRTSIVEAGDITGQEKNDGERMKNASSDAFKRCAMRLGLGLHLWAGADYFLDGALAKAAPVVDVELPGLDVDATGLCVECGRDPNEHAPRCSRKPF